MIDLDRFISFFHAEDLRDAFAAKWDDAQKANPPAEYAQALLAPAALEANWKMSSFREDSLPQLQAMAARICESDELLALAAFMHWWIFMDRDPDGQWKWPDLHFCFDEVEIGCFNFVIALGFLPEYSARQRELGIPENVISESLLQIPCYAFNFHRGTGKAGIYLGQLSWLHCYMPPARYYRLGRLEFQQTKYNHPFKIYRNRTDGSTVALCVAGFWLMPDGEACFAGEEHPADAWETTLNEGTDGVEGYAVMTDGHVSRESVFLPFDEWECALAPGDSVLAMHIPSGGGMRPELAVDSLKRSFAFFDKYYPDKPVKAIFCSSWIFSNQLTECLPPESNILALQEMVHLVPLSGGKSAGLWFVFLVNPPFDVAALPRDTSMCRNIAEWLEKGNEFHVGGMYITREEVARLTIEQKA